MCSACFPRSSRRPTLRFPPQGPPRRVPLLHRYYQSATTSCRPSRRASLPSLGGTSVCTRCVRSLADECHRQGLELVSPVSPAGISLRRRQDLASSWGISIVHSRMFSRRRQDGCTRPLRCSRVAPGMRKAEAPTKGLSTLNSMAFGLAVYASQCGLPTPHARLTSGRWSGATGRAFNPQDSAERFPSCFLTSHPPFPSFLSQSHPPRSLSPTRKRFVHMQSACRTSARKMHHVCISSLGWKSVTGESTFRTPPVA